MRTTVALLLLITAGCHKDPSPDAAFWRWFTAHAPEVAKMRHADEPIANELAAELHKIDSRLTFELGVRMQPHELIISADGLRALFPTVRRLVAAAPSLPTWRVIAFRPRKGIGAIELGSGLKVSTDAITFEVLPTTKPGNQLDLALYVPGIGGSDDNGAKQAAFLLLDAALGEYDVETKLGKIDFRATDAKPASARPFRELAGVVDAWH